MTDIDPAAQALWDAARRASDAVRIHIAAVGAAATGKWVAVALCDGRSDGILYDSKADAVRHQFHESLYAYVCVPPGGMPVADAVVYLREMRRMRDAGVRIADPDKHVHIITR